MSAEDLFSDVVGDELVQRYKVAIQVKNLIVGGVPGDPSVIKSWLRAKMDLDDQALTELLNQTIAEREGPMTVEEKVDALAASEHAPSVNGFKRNSNRELCIEARSVKSMLKEAANSAFPGVDYPGKKDAVAKQWAASRKGLLSTLNEHVFVYGPYGGEDGDQLISLGTKDPSWVEERVKHVVTPQGPRSSINRVEVVEHPLITFTMGVHDDFLPREAWKKIWTRAEDIGIGADRGRSDGMFSLVEFTKIKA